MGDAEKDFDISPYDILNLHRPTGVSALFSTVPKPEGSELEKGLPSWKLLPLGTKLPMKHAPKGAVVFTRGKLGDKLWRGSNAAEFNLADPYCYDVTYNYESLHDSHLKHWFEMESNKKPLLRGKFVTKDDVVLCSLKEYNQFRRYLNRLHGDNVNVEKSLKEELEQEKYFFDIVQKNYLLDLQRLEKREAMAEIIKANRAKEQKKLDRKLEACRQRLLRAEAANLRLMKEREDDKAMRAMTGLAIAAEMKRKAALSMKMERIHKAETIRKLRKDDEIRVWKAAKAAEEKQKQKNQMEQMRWERKMASDEIQARKAEQMLLQYDRYIQLNVARRVERARKNRLACEQQLIKIKSKKVFDKIEKKRLDETGKLAKEILKHLIQREPRYAYLDVSSRHKDIYDALVIMKENVGGYNQVLRMRKLWPSMEQSRDRPLAALAVNRQLKIVAQEFLRIYLEEQIKYLVRAAKAEIKRSGVAPGSKFLRPARKRREEKTRDRKESLPRQRSSKLTAPPIPASSYICLDDLNRIARGVFTDVGIGNALKKARISLQEVGEKLNGGSVRSVSFSDHVGVQRLTDERQTELKNVSDRPPTPMPSAVELAEAAFTEPISETSLETEEIRIPDPFLVDELKKFCKRLFKLILRRAFRMRLIGFQPILPKRIKEDVSTGIAIVLMEKRLDDIKEDDLATYVDVLTEHVLYPEMRQLKFLADEDEGDFYCYCEECTCINYEEEEAEEDNSEENDGEIGQ